MKQTIDVRPKMSDEDRKALRLFRLSAFVAGVVAIAVATGFGFALRPFLHWDADRTGAERRAQERLRDIEEAAAKREADLLHVFEEKKKAIDSAIVSEEKRKAFLEIDIDNARKRETKAIQAANEAEEELASKRKEIESVAPTLSEGKAAVARIRDQINQASNERDSLIESNSTLRAELARVQAELSATMLRKQETEENLSKLGDLREQLESIENKKRSTFEERQDIERTIEEKKSNLAFLAAQEAMMSNQIENVKAELIGLKNDYQETNIQFEARKNEFDKLSRSVERYRGYQLAYSNQVETSRIDELRLQKIKEDIEMLRREKDQTVSDFETARKEFLERKAQLKTEIHQQETILNKLNASIKDARNILNSLTSSSSQEPETEQSLGEGDEQ